MCNAHKRRNGKCLFSTLHIYTINVWYFDLCSTMWHICDRRGTDIFTRTQRNREREREIWKIQHKCDAESTVANDFLIMITTMCLSFFHSRSLSIFLSLAQSKIYSISILIQLITWMYTLVNSKWWRKKNFYCCCFLLIAISYRKKIYK